MLCVSLAIEAGEHGGVRERQAILDAQPPHELPERDAELARDQRRIGLASHRVTISTGN